MQPARAKARGFIKTLFLAHRIANNPRTVQRAARTDNQPAAQRPQRTAHTAHLQHCTRFVVLCARLFGSWD
jgi:hypothetical protein